MEGCVRAGRGWSVCAGVLVRCPAVLIAHKSEQARGRCIQLTETLSCRKMNRTVLKQAQKPCQKASAAHTQEPHSISELIKHSINDQRGLFTRVFILLHFLALIHPWNALVAVPNQNKPWHSYLALEGYRIKAALKCTQVYKPISALFHITLKRDSLL